MLPLCSLGHPHFYIQFLTFKLSVDMDRFFGGRSTLG
jgi:hypothetical protein